MTFRLEITLTGEMCHRDVANGLLDTIVAVRKEEPSTDLQHVPIMSIYGTQQIGDWGYYD
jgi:hypothetical protein